MNARPVHLVFMLEEETAMVFLQNLLSGILPANVTCQYIPHQGKSDLRKSIPVKMGHWVAHPNVNTIFVIVHDQDNHPDCKKLKRELQDLCRNSRYASLIRIVCRELESWYFGDLDAVEKAFPGFVADKYKRRAKFRNPDVVTKPSDQLRKIVNGFAKGKAARTMPQYMDLNGNTSDSFNQFVAGIKRLI